MSSDIPVRRAHHHLELCLQICLYQGCLRFKLKLNCGPHLCNRLFVHNPVQNAIRYGASKSLFHYRFILIIFDIIGIHGHDKGQTCSSRQCCCCSHRYHGALTSIFICPCHREKVSCNSLCIHGPYQVCSIDQPITTIGLKPRYVEDIVFLHLRAHNLLTVAAQR